MHAEPLLWVLWLQTTLLKETAAKVDVACAAAETGLNKDQRDLVNSGGRLLGVSVFVSVPASAPFAAVA